jgi:hypothetical protein
VGHVTKEGNRSNNQGRAINPYQSSVWPDFTKNNRPRLAQFARENTSTVPFSPDPFVPPDKYLAEARPNLLRDPAQPLLFITGKGRKLHPNDLSARVRRYMTKAGVTKTGACHLFRHTAATLMLDAGADIRHIQAILGHENLSTTQIYTHVSIGKLCEVHARTHPGCLLRKLSASSVSPRSWFRLPMAAARQIPQRVTRMLQWLRRTTPTSTTP